MALADREEGVAILRALRLVESFCAPRATRRLRFAKGLPGGSENRIKRDSFTSVAELELAIDLYIADHNARPKPFIWTASGSDIVAKVTRAKAALKAVPRQVQNSLAHHTSALLRSEARTSER